MGGLGGTSLGGGGLGAPMGGGGMGAPLGGGGGLGGPLSGGLGGGMQAQAPSLPPEVVQKIESAMQDPAFPTLCPGKDRSATAVGEDCWKKIWAHVGCQESTSPPYEQWHNTQSLEILVADAAQWASLPSERHRTTCYGAGRADL